MMMITEEAVSFQKGLMDWLTEESEYLLQRLDRWTTIARGYNRLYPQRLSRGCMTMQKEPDEESWRHSPSFKILSASSSSSSSRRITRPTDEIRKINCCGTFNYQSNSRVDNSCLEEYRYDHSIYFKTIGDIKSTKNIKETDDLDEQVQEETLDCDESLDHSETLDKSVIEDCPSPMDEEMSEEITWFDKNYSEVLNEEFSRSCCIEKSETFVDQKYDNDDDNLNNNDIRCLNLNGPILHADTESLNSKSLMTSVEEKNYDNEGNVVFNARKPNRRTKTIKQPKVRGDNNVSWPGVLFSYNIDPSLASSHHCVLNVK